MMLWQKYLFLGVRELNRVLRSKLEIGDLLESSRVGADDR